MIEITHITNRRNIFLTARLAGSVALLLWCSFIALAQGGASVAGHVMDQTGANVLGAEVRLRSQNGAQLFARTDAAGQYNFTNLGPGDYLLEVMARGFTTQTSESFRVDRGAALARDFQLSLEGLSESVIVVANGTPQRVDEVSKAVTLVGEQQLEDKRELTLPEALRGTPGLRVQQQGSFGAVTSLRLRGGRNSDTALLLDGLRVRDASDINGSALPLITDLLPANLDRVEILRGSGSSIYGTNAIGGVINLVPKTGAGSPHFEASVEGGSLALFREQFKGAGGVGQRAGFSFGLTRLDVRRGVDGQDEYGNTAGGGRFSFNPTPSITIGANFYGTLSNARTNDSPFALPGAFTTGAQYPIAVARATFQPDFNNPDQGRRNRLLVGSIRFTHSVNEILSYTLAYQRVTTKRRNYNGAQIDPRFAAFYPFGDFEFTSLNNGATDTLDGRASIRLGRSNLITAGFELERESLFQQFNSAFSSGVGTTDRQRTSALFGQDQIFLFDNRLQLSIGVRGQSYKIRAADRPGFLSSVDAESSVTGDGSIAYFIRSTGTKLRAHVGNGFRAPALFERFGEGTFSGLGFARFGDPTLRAEQSISVDGGFDQQMIHDRLRFGATYFYTKLQRTISFTGFAADPLGLGRFSGYVNRQGGMARGLESYFEAAPFRRTELRATYTYTNSDQFVPALGLQQEYVIPRHLFSLNLNQRYRAFNFNFDLNRTGAYVAPVFENDFPFRTAILTFKGYTKADVFVGYERLLSERVRLILFGGAENIFAQKYYENGFRAPGALGRGGASIKF